MNTEELEVRSPGHCICLILLILWVKSEPQSPGGSGMSAFRERPLGWGFVERLSQKELPCH